MRLTSREIQLLISVFNKNLGDIPFQIFLFGSRTSDQKKGGDIDLLLKVSTKNYANVLDLKSSLKFELEEAMGDQRVDLTLVTEESFQKDAFLASIRDELISLER